MAIGLTVLGIGEINIMIMVMARGIFYAMTSQLIFLDKWNTWRSKREVRTTN